MLNPAKAYVEQFAQVLAKTTGSTVSHEGGLFAADAASGVKEFGIKVESDFKRADQYAAAAESQVRAFKTNNSAVVAQRSGFPFCVGFLLAHIWDNASRLGTHSTER